MSTKLNIRKWLIAGDQKSPHARQVGSQHSFGLPLRRRGMHRAQTDQTLFQLLSLEKAKHSFGHEGFDLSRPHTPTLG